MILKVLTTSEKPVNINGMDEITKWGLVAKVRMIKV